MKPFDNAFAELSTALGKIDASLVNTLEAVEDVKSTEGTIHALNKKNSYGRFSAVGFRGTVDASYNRIDLSALFGAALKQDMVVRTRSKPANAHQALKLVNRKWQLGLIADQVENLPVVYDGNDIGVCTIKAVAGDLAVFGQFSFTVQPGPDNISDLGLNYDLTNALYPSGQTAKGQAQLISYPVDTTEHNAEVAALFANKPIDADLVTLVSTLTGVQWSLNAGDYSLSGASITYVGVVRPGWDLTKPNFSRVAVIRLGTACSNFAGDLVFYHNPN